MLVLQVFKKRICREVGCQVSSGAHQDLWLGEFFKKDAKRRPTCYDANTFTDIDPLWPQIFNDPVDITNQNTPDTNSMEEVSVTTSTEKKETKVHSLHSTTSLSAEPSYDLSRSVGISAGEDTHSQRNHGKLSQFHSIGVLDRLLNVSDSGKSTEGAHLSKSEGVTETPTTTATMKSLTANLNNGQHFQKHHLFQDDKQASESEKKDNLNFYEDNQHRMGKQMTSYVKDLGKGHDYLQQKQQQQHDYLGEHVEEHENSPLLPITTVSYSILTSTESDGKARNVVISLSDETRCDGCDKPAVKRAHLRNNFSTTPRS